MWQVGRLVQHIREVVEEVDAVASAGASQGVEDASSLGALVACQKERIENESVSVEKQWQKKILGTKAGDALPFNDEYLKYQWHYKNTGDKSFSATAVAGADIDVFPVWEKLTTGDRDIIVAVVDEGVCYSHEDLAANMWTNDKEIPGNGIDDDGNGYIDDVHGYNFVDDGDISWTKSGDTGHGTFCAGTIAAVNNNGKGVSGIAGGSGNGDGCRIMSCQIFSGNESHPYAHYPGAIYDIISVSAIGPDMLPTNYTNYGPGCNIAAPGGEIGQIDTFRSLVLSTVPADAAFVDKRHR